MITQTHLETITCGKTLFLCILLLLAFDYGHEKWEELIAALNEIK